MKVSYLKHTTTGMILAASSEVFVQLRDGSIAQSGAMLDEIGRFTLIEELLPQPTFRPPVLSSALQAQCGFSRSNSASSSAAGRVAVCSHLRELQLSPHAAQTRFLDSARLPVKTGNPAPLEMTTLG
jgi:hypothetical protein